MFSLIILPYLKRLWLPIAIGLMVLGAWWYVHHLQASRDTAITALNNYKSAQTALANQQLAENAIKLAGAQSKVNLADNLSTSKLTELHLDRKTETNNLKALYENKPANPQRNMVHSVQSSTADSASTLPNIARDTEATATSKSIDHTAFAKLQSQYDTLEKACIITTIDFNNLRAWGDVVCNIATCE